MTPRLSFYQMGDYYTPGDAAGLRFDDPKLGIQWPLPVASISEKDLAWPLLKVEGESECQPDLRTVRLIDWSLDFGLGLRFEHSPTSP